MAKCFICQKAPVGSDGFRCDPCRERMESKHTHDWKPFKFSPGSKIIYYSCECGEQRMIDES